MKLVLEVQRLSNSYVRKGGKDNRRQQRARMLAFAEHAAAMGASSLGQVGKSHVITYWKSHRDLSDATLYSHWLAVRELWRLAGKPGDPPRPRLASVTDDLQASPSFAATGSGTASAHLLEPLEGP